MTGAPRPLPRLLTVTSASYLTPHMVRVTLTGEWLKDFADGQEGAHCKLIFPKPGESLESFRATYAEGRPKQKVHDIRTYTVRAFRRDTLEMDIDFVAHGAEGPATRWAQSAKPGDFLLFMGPGPVKLETFYADWYLVAADMSALPVAAAALEAMPREAKGVAVFEVQSAEDRQVIDAPEGVDIHWLLLPDPHVSSTAQLDFMKTLDFPQGAIQTCIAGESGAIRAIRDYLHNEKQLDKKAAYISGYWKVGLVEDQHQEAKRAGNAG
ncbi:MAG: siderophore-interacting protein [Rhodobacteraceae bacterium]|nr:siderophore-interacting protein [Paracoccaceae bacterium]